MHNSVFFLYLINDNLFSISRKATNMKPKVTLWQRAFLLLTLAIFSNFVQAQLKIGDNPYFHSKSSILELESTPSGFAAPQRFRILLPSVLLTPPDGMIIFLSTDKSLRLRSKAVVG